MKIDLYRMSCEHNRVDKSKYLELLLSTNGTLRERCSIYNPSILVQIDDNFFSETPQDKDVVYGNDLQKVVTQSYGKVLYEGLRYILSCNYCYIELFNRYYYVNEIFVERNNLIRIELSCDVLMSFRNEIMKQTLLIDRNEYDYNLFLDDKYITKENKYDITIYLYDTFKTRDALDTNEIAVNTDGVHYIITTVSTATDISYSGSNSIDNSPLISPTIVTAYIDTSEDYFTFSKELYNPDFWTNVKMIFLQSSDWVSSIKLCPIDMLTIRNSSPVAGVGMTDKSGILVSDKITSSDVGYTIAGASKLYFYSELPNNLVPKDFTDLSPYSKYLLYLPFHGYVEVDSDHFSRGVYKYVVYQLDIPTGDFIAYLSSSKPSYADNPSAIPSQYWSGNLYTEIPVGKTNMAEVDANRMRSGLNALLGAITSGGAAIGGIAMGGAMGGKAGDIYAAGQGMQGINSQFGALGNYLINEITNRSPRGSAGEQKSGALIYRLSHIPYILKVKPHIHIPSNYNHVFGRPLYQTRMMSEVKGFTTVLDVHLKGFTNATEHEQVEIISLLENGVFMPDE